MKGGRQCFFCQACCGWILAKCCCCVSGKDPYSVSSGENGGKSDSVATLQTHSSLNLSQSSPLTKRSGNTLKKWLTSPVRRLSSGKGDSNIKKQKKGRKSFDRGSPKPGDDAANQGDSADESRKEGPGGGSLSKSSSGMQSGGEDENDEESHTPLPPPMKIIENDTTQEDMTLEDGSYRGSFKDAGYLPEPLPSSLPPRNAEEEQKAKALRGRMFVLNELVQTEKDYVKDLGLVVEGFMQNMEEKGVPEDMKGRDKIVFGNIVQIYDWHRKFFMGELEKCLQDPDKLAQLFIKHERRLHMYVVYCQNKPKSEYIILEYDDYFEELKLELNQRLSLSDFLIKPIQRITKYQLLLKDFLKYSEKAGLECSEIQKAFDIMCLVPKHCNDMMNLGRLQGFEGKLTAQGKLLQQDTFFVTEQDSGVLSRSKERRVFLFEQIVIFSELLRKGSTPEYLYKKSIKMNYLKLESSIENDPCKFALQCRASSERFVLQAANPEIKQAWVEDVAKVLEAQLNFLEALQSPIEYHKKECNSVVVPNRISQLNSKPQSPPSGLEKQVRAGSHNAALPPLTISTSSSSPGYDHYHLGDKYEPGKNNMVGCNGTSSMIVTQDYFALKENEISVNQGEVVQVLTVNQQNMYLVYRSANDHSPAAEGWIPGYTLSPIPKTITDSSDGSVK